MATLDVVTLQSDEFAVSPAAAGPTSDSEVFDGVVFSAKFIVTYQFVLLGIVTLFTLRHWIRHWAQSRRRRRLETASGLQSPIDTNKTEPRAAQLTPESSGKDVGDFNEDQSLLRSERGSTQVRFWKRSRLQLRSLWMYQPPPLRSAGIALPDNGTTLLVLVLLALNVFYAIYRIKFSLRLLLVFADRAGLLFVANLPWLYLLGAKNQPFRMLTGSSYEGLNLLHRRLGEWLCLIAIIHGVGLIAVWYVYLRPAGLDVWTFFLHRTIWTGLCAFVCYEALYYTSTASFRQWWYEVFLGCHVFFQAGGLIFVFFHHKGTKTYIGIALAIFLIDRLIFRLLVKTRSIEASLTIMDDENTIMLSADWPIQTRWRKFWGPLLAMDTRYGWKPTEHVFITVPALAKKHVIQAHPFTIASAAPEQGQQHAWFNLIIRAYNGFTRDLIQHAKLHTSVQTRIDGPYGSMHAVDMLRSSDAAIVVAGGSGIAVAHPIVWTLMHEHRRAAEEGTTLHRPVCLIWVVQDARHVEWIGLERLDELKALGMRLVLPPPTSKAGRPDIKTLMRDAVHELLDADLNKSVGVVVSGPNAMNQDVRNACSLMAWKGRDVTVAVEKFGW